MENLCHRHFDHSPFLLRCGSVASVRVTKPFRFLATWPTHPKYDLVVSNAWRDGSSGVPKSLDRVQSDSLTFNKEKFGNILKKKRELEARFSVILNLWILLVYID